MIEVKKKKRLSQLSNKWISTQQRTQQQTDESVKRLFGRPNISWCDSFVICAVSAKCPWRRSTASTKYVYSKTATRNHSYYLPANICVHLFAALSMDRTWWRWILARNPHTQSVWATYLQWPAVHTNARVLSLSLSLSLTLIIWGTMSSCTIGFKCKENRINLFH